MQRLIFALLLLGPGLRADNPPPPTWRLRLGFNSSMFVGVNENDARASIRALSASIAHDHGITAEPNPQIFSGSDSIGRAVDAEQVDAIGLTTPEFKELADDRRFDRYLFSVHGEDPTEEYVLLVNRSDRLAQIGQLQGKTLVMVDGPRLSLAMPWLEVSLATAGLPEGGKFFRQITHQIKPTKAILDTYFHKSDACLATRAAFAAMTELNPQIGTRLQVLASSAPVIPSLFAIRTGLEAKTKEHVITVFTSVHETLSGQQALTIFQVTRVVERPLGALEPSFALLEQFAKLRPERAAEYRRRVRESTPTVAPESR